jgi:thioredoxin-like negative regulator of GroEL
MALQIQGIPTILAFKGGRLIHRDSGALNKSQFDGLIQAVAEFDVEAAEAEAAKNAEG